MGANSSIEWCDHTFNPWWGCVRVSPGCERCYAETFAKRVGHKVWGVQAERRFFGDKHWAEPLKWNADAGKAGVRRRVFCASMADVFEDRPDLVEPRWRLFGVIENTPRLDWLLLTKRPENISALMPKYYAGEPWPNVWLGTTVEDVARRSRLNDLRKANAVVRFVSLEPLLEDLAGHLDLSGIHWAIVGGESGPGARPFSLAWARWIALQCRAAGVACFVKQLGAKPFGDGNEELLLDDRKGGDPSEWPEDIRVREFPSVRA